MGLPVMQLNFCSARGGDSPFGQRIVVAWDEGLTIKLIMTKRAISNVRTESPRPLPTSPQHSMFHIEYNVLRATQCYSLQHLQRHGTYGMAVGACSGNPVMCFRRFDGKSLKFGSNDQKECTTLANVQARGSYTTAAVLMTRK